MNLSAYFDAPAAPVRSASRAILLSGRVERLAHRLIALLALLVLSPVLMSVAWLIWRTDGAPIFFGQYRVGRDGRLFKCLKFRSMRVDAQQVLSDLLSKNPDAKAEWQRDQKLSNDPRVTPIGRWLRKTSLDELPQLLNVLRGEMCFVGPRPVTPAELVRYGNTRWHYVSVEPGITGLWQVSGRNNTSYAERVALDRSYVENRNPWMDIKILFQTVRVVLTGHGAS